MNQLSKPLREANMEPMKLGELLDRSIRLSPAVYKRLFLLFFVVAALSVVGQLPQLDGSENPVLAILAAGSVLVSSLMGFYVMIVSVFLSAEYWLGNTSITREEVKQKATFKLALRILGLFFVVTAGTIFWSLFFLIPGIIYMIRRILALYILVYEDLTVKESIAKSKEIMKLGKWYKSTSPIFRVSVIGLLSMFFAFVATAGVLGVMYLEASSSNLGLATTFFLMLIATLLQQLFGVFSYVAYAGVYFDARARFEGSDILADLEPEDPTIPQSPQ